MLVFRNSQQKPAGAWDQFLGHLLGKNPRLDGRSVAPLKRKTTVLLAEHEASVREFSALVLRSLGCRVLEAADGREALAMVRRLPGAGERHLSGIHGAPAVSTG